MNSQLKRYIAVILLIISIFTLFTGSYAYDPAEGAFPKIDEVFGSQNNSPYLTKYINNYYLDMREMGAIERIQKMEGAFNGIANLLFTLQAYLARMLIIVVYYAYEIDVYSIFSGLIDSVFKEMKLALFDELSMVAIVLLGIYYLTKIIADQKTQVWVAILQTVFILVLALALFNNPTGMLKRIDEYSKDMSRSVLAGTYKATNQGHTPKSAVIAASNDIWIMFVHKPWQILEFGSIEIAEREQDKILSLAPGSKERQAIIDELAKDGKLFSPDWGIKRTGFMLLYMLPMFVMGVIIGALALLIIGYQFLAMFFTLMGIFVFILALVPFFGPRIINNWASKIIANGFIKVLISFILALIFAVNAALFNLIGVYGWFVILMLQIAMILMIVWKKNDFVELFTSMRRAVQTGNMQKPMKKDINLESRLNKYSDQISFRRRSSKYSDNNEFEEVETPSGARQFKRVTDPGSVDGQGLTTSNTRASELSNSDSIINGIEVRVAQVGEITHMNDNLKALIRKAEELLERKFDDEKQEAEEHSNKLRKEPEYSSFVKRVQTREELGAPRFENREISAVAKSIQIAQRAGGTADDVYMGMRTKEIQEIERPKSLESIKVDVSGENVDLDKQEAYKILERQYSGEYADEFNQHYNKQYDKAFFEELFKKYGQENVRTMLDRMKDIEEREDHMIQNPAGYLTTALKKNQRDKVGQEKSSEKSESEHALSNMRNKVNKGV